MVYTGLYMFIPPIKMVMNGGWFIIAIPPLNVSSFFRYYQVGNSQKMPVSWWEIMHVIVIRVISGRLTWGKVHFEKPGVKDLFNKQKNVVCISVCGWLFWRFAFPFFIGGILEGKDETQSFESSSVPKVLWQYLSKDLTASTTKRVWCNRSRIGPPGNLQQFLGMVCLFSFFSTKSSEVLGFHQAWNPVEMSSLPPQPVART